MTGPSVFLGKMWGGSRWSAGTQHRGTQPHCHPSPSHNAPSPLAGDIGLSRRMENSMQSDGGLLSAELWASHNRVMLEPLESNDPEVRTLSWPLPGSHFLHPRDSQRDSVLLEPGMGQGDSPRLSWWDPSILHALFTCSERWSGRASSNMAITLHLWLLSASGSSNVHTRAASPPGHVAIALDS